MKLAVNLPEGNPCKVMLDLKEFTKFDATNSRLSQGTYIRINKDKVTISASLGREHSEGDKVSLLINKKGNILVMQNDPSENGLRIRSQSGGGASISKFVSCKSLIKHVTEKLGLELPVQYNVKYDEELQAWVGRR